MKRNLTTKTLESLKPGGKRYEVRDGLLPCFGVRVTVKGRKSFFVNVRHLKHQRRVLLGRHPFISLAEARAKARLVISDPDAYFAMLEEKKSRLTVKQAVDLFVELYAKQQNKDWKGAKKRLESDFVELYGDRPLAELKRFNITAVLDRVMARTKGAQPNRKLAGIRKFLNWSVERGYIETNPAQGISAPIKEIPRDRVLNDDELKAVWDVSLGLAYPFREFMALLILTGQRRGEVAGMRWSELDLDDKVWVIPAARTKNGREHHVPLSHSAVEFLNKAPRFLGSDFVLTTTSKTPISGFGKIKGRIDKQSKVADWRFHDLRRTTASGMARLGTDPHVIEKVLNHSTGIISGVAAVYNHYGYDEEKRQALELWAEHVGSFSTLKQAI